MGKAIVAYLSVSGAATKAAERLVGAIGADLYEIKPETPYTSTD